MRRHTSVVDTGEVDGNINNRDGASALKDFVLALHRCLAMMVAICCGFVSLMDLPLLE